MNIKLPFIFDNDVKCEIKDFVNTSNSSYWIENTTCNTKNRRYCNICKFPFLNLYSKINFLRNKVFNFLNLKNIIDEHVYGNFIGVNKQGGNVHVHRDPPFKNYYHVRVNCLIQKPTEGGMPIVNGVEYNINEGECWFNNATLWDHGSTIVDGQIDRIVLSLGAYISSSDFHSVNNLVLKN